MMSYSLSLFVEVVSSFTPCPGQRGYDIDGVQKIYSLCLLFKANFTFLDAISYGHTEVEMSLIPLSVTLMLA
jgi:hypothetical protein